MADQFAGTMDSVAAPATRVAAVVPHDTQVLGDLPKALFVGTGGSIVLRGASGSEAVLKNVASGTVLPVRAALVKATGTTAADIVALY